MSLFTIFESYDDYEDLTYNLLAFKKEVSLVGDADWAFIVSCFAVVFKTDVLYTFDEFCNSQEYKDAKAKVLESISKISDVHNKLQYWSYDEDDRWYEIIGGGDYPEYNPLSETLYQIKEILREGKIEFDEEKFDNNADQYIMWYDDEYHAADAPAYLVELTGGALDEESALEVIRQAAQKAENAYMPTMNKLVPLCKEFAKAIDELYKAVDADLQVWLEGSGNADESDASSKSYGVRSMDGADLDLPILYLDEHSSFGEIVDDLMDFTKAMDDKVSSIGNRNAQQFSNLVNLATWLAGFTIYALENGQVNYATIMTNDAIDTTGDTAYEAFAASADAIQTPVTTIKRVFKEIESIVFKGGVNEYMEVVSFLDVFDEGENPDWDFADDEFVLVQNYADKLLSATKSAFGKLVVMSVLAKEWYQSRKDEFDNLS